MNLALLMGNRFTPWHLKGYGLLRDQPEISAFRAESEIQRRFHEQDDGSVRVRYETIYFDNQAGNPVLRVANAISERYFGREPRILPFRDRLKDYDIVQSWELFTDWTSEAARAHTQYSVPLVLMIWDNIPFNLDRIGYRREIKRMAIEAADVFIVHTDRSTRMLALDGAAMNKVVKMNPGVDTNSFRPGHGDRAAFGLRDDEFVILFVGWLLPRKGIDFLLIAFSELLNDKSLGQHRIRLLIIGTGPGRERIETLIDKLRIRDHCTFGGSLPYNKMPEVFRVADLFVLPSIATDEWQEQFGMAIIEAMASGVPVVTTCSGAITEITGDAAVLCQPNDFVSLHKAIKGLLLNKKRHRELSDMGRSRAIEHFSLQPFADALSQVYASLNKQ